MLFEVLVLLVAGLGAGFITGLLSASAVMFAAPVLIIFLGMPPYQAIGISLGIDVFASLTAGAIFYKNKNLDLRGAILLIITAVIFVLIGSYFSQFIPQSNLAWAIGLGIFGMGVLTYNRGKKDLTKDIEKPGKIKHIYVVLAGAGIGLVTGVFGAGGGILILFSLMFLLKYKVHKAIGTSVVIMVFIALFGGASHYYHSPFPIWYLVIGAFAGIVGAYFTSIVANKANENKLAKFAGIVLCILGLALFAKSMLL